MVAWHDLGLARRGTGDEFGPANVTCPFCGGHGRFNRVYRGERHDEAATLDLVSDVWQCIECANFVFVAWRGGQGVFEYRVYPYDREQAVAHPAWPDSASHAYGQALEALFGDDWDMAVVMAKRCIGESLRAIDTEGNSLLEELANAKQHGWVSQGLVRWAEHMPQLQRQQPPNGSSWRANDAHELVRFARYVLDLLFTLPFDAESHRHY